MNTNDADMKTFDAALKAGYPNYVKNTYEGAAK